MEKVIHLSKKRNLEGNSATPLMVNYMIIFFVLSNQEIMLRSTMMGVNIPYDNLESIDLLRELEKARSNLNEKKVRQL
jgi:hypothetical protein